jgi:hypothetical protein
VNNLFPNSKTAFALKKCLPCLMALVWFGLTAAVVPAGDQAGSFFQITVVDAETGRGVPLVELRTVNAVRYVTDSNGIIALQEPGLMDQEVFFHVQSHGYEYPKDFLDNRGLKLKIKRGGSAQIKINRLNIAERLYRVTGEGIYRDSVLTGHRVPLRQPLLNGQVMGQDTVIVTPYRGKLYWFWGDTDRVSYPLGNFAASGATSELPGRGGLDPVVGVDLTYFVDGSGFSKGMCPDFGPGFHWIECVMTVPDDTGVERLVARVSSQMGLVAPYAWRLAVFNDAKQIFEPKARWECPDSHDSAHPFRARVGGVEYLYLYPNFRVPAEFRSLADPNSSEAFTCLAGDGKLGGASPQIDRDATGAPRYSWKPGAARLYAGRLQELISQGVLTPGESWLHLHNFETGTPITAGRGSVFWNEFRQRWIMLVSSAPGEIWFAAGDTPTGPWCYARRVVSHHDYNFYNPTQHPFFDQERGRVIYFEGTYSESFSAAKEKTPRYDYNQIMYRLALDDARLILPAPVYRVAAENDTRLMLREGVESASAWDRVKSIAFFAVPPPQARAGLIPIYQDATRRLNLAPSASATPLFLALPAQSDVTNGIAGKWLCQANEQNGGKFEWELVLAERYGAVEARSPDGQVAGRGKFGADKLTLTLAIGGQSYELVATLRDRLVTGDWKRRDGKESGTWRAHWQDPTPAEYRSPAILPLYEYHRDSAPGFVYSTDPNLSASGFTRRDQPVCRVWQNPFTTLTFDPRQLQLSQ